MDTSNQGGFWKGFGIGAVIIAVIALIGLFGMSAANKAYGAITAPPSNFSYILASQSVDSPLFRYVLAVVNNTVTSQVSVQAVRSSLTAATTTPCALQNPFNATTTINDVSLVVTTATSSAGQFVFATSTTPYNYTTSPIASESLAANAQGTFVTGETASSTGLGVVVPPNGYIVIGMGTGSAVSYGYTYGGTCTAIFQGTAS